jgi:hypothetical protein
VLCQFDAACDFISVITMLFVKTVNSAKSLSKSDNSETSELVKSGR